MTLPHDDNQPLEIRADFYWALIPEWLLYADVTANAVRLYAILARHADKDTRQCHPTRGTLASLMKASRATVDRAMNELVEIGAVTVRQRKTPKGDWTSNSYVVRTIEPRGVSSPVSTPLITGEETGVITRDEQTRVSTNQSQERRARQKPNAGDHVAKQWWEAQNPKPAGKGAWHALVNACRAVADRGWEHDQILNALNKIGAVPSVAQLDRELRSPRAETWTERKAREEAEERAAIAKRHETERLEAAERQRKLDEERAQAVPPPPEFREAVARLRRGRSDA